MNPLELLLVGAAKEALKRPLAMYWGKNVLLAAFDVALWRP